MTTAYRLGAAALVAAATAQWSGIGERLLHARRMSYKFAEYGGGHTDLGITMTVFTYVASSVLIASCFFLARQCNDTVADRSAKAAATSLGLGLLTLTVLLLSPYGELIGR